MPTLRRWRNVLIHVEQIARIIRAFHRSQLVVVRSVAGLDALLTFHFQEVDVRALIRIGTQRLPLVTDPLRSRLGSPIISAHTGDVGDPIVRAMSECSILVVGSSQVWC